MNRDNYRDKYLFNNYMQKAIEVAERQFRNQKVKNCNPYAEVPIEFLYRNGLKETKRLKLRKDEDGVWGFKVVIND